MSTASKRDRLKPLELITIAAVVGLFTGGIVLLSSRDLTLTAIWFGIAFIVALVVLAMFVLAAKPNKNELLDIQELDAEASKKSAH
ncbi:MAG: hypothetical protein RIR88_264 [Actinomycetota bacterium]|jgi:hypothetical protein